MGKALDSGVYLPGVRITTQQTLDTPLVDDVKRKGLGPIYGESSISKKVLNILFLNDIPSFLYVPVKKNVYVCTVR